MCAQWAYVVVIVAGAERSMASTPQWFEQSKLDSLSVFSVS